MYKKSKRIGIIVLSLIFFMSFTSLTFSYTEQGVKGLIDGTESAGIIGTAGEATENIMGTIISVIQIVGVGVAIIMLVMVAVKYMTAAPSEKAEFKKSAVAYIVGAVLIFGTTGILEIIQNFADKNLQ